jgi:hypothetical protein
VKSLGLNKSSLDCNSSPEPVSVTSSNSFMGKFIKLPGPLYWTCTPSLRVGDRENVECHTGEK